MRTLEVIDQALFDYASFAVEVSHCEVNDEATKNDEEQRRQKTVPMGNFDNYKPIQNDNDHANHI